MEREKEKEEGIKGEGWEREEEEDGRRRVERGGGRLKE